MKKIAYIVVGIVIFLVVAGFITKAVIEKVTRDITEREVRRITGGEIDRITQEKTEGITQRILGVSRDAKSLQTVECDKKPLPRQFSSASYYTGPLIDAHLHMPFTFDVPKALYAQADHDGAILEKDVAAGSIMCVFDKTGVQSAIGFYVIPSLLKGQAVVQIKEIGEKFPGRITPFLMPAHVSAFNLQPADVESVLNANPGLFKGYGEIGMYKDAYKGTSPDDASLLPFYDIADKYGLVVMMHPDIGQRQAIEKILQDYSSVNFLFHGDEKRSYAAEIVAKYPNAYYSIEGDLSDIPDEHESANLYGDKTKEEFVVKFKRDYETILATAITNWKGPIEKNPDKFLWGTDRAYPMHFDEEVGGLLDEIARAFIGQLDPAAQEKFAYRNAERLIGIDEEEDISKLGLGKLCSSLAECFVFCKNNGRCTDFCIQNPSHRLCKQLPAAKPQPWVPDAVTQPLPEGASSVRLILPAPIDDIALDQIGGYGAHPTGHAEGLDHEWIWVKDDKPILSWADGEVMYVNTVENRIQEDTPSIVIYYGDGLWGEHMHVRKALVQPGDKVKAGDPVGYGELYAHSPGYQFAEFNVADQHRRDGVGYWYKFVKGATLVSPFDYLRDDVKQQLVEKWQKEVIDAYLLQDKNANIPATPWEPYLTNPILFHKNYPGKLEGEWFLRSKAWGLDNISDTLIFFTNNTKYYSKQRIFGVEEVEYENIRTLLAGDWNADYKKGRLVMKIGNAAYYGIFELDESAPQARLKIEYQTGTYPAGFSELAAVYTERETISKAEERHYWQHPEDDPRNW